MSAKSEKKENNDPVNVKKTWTLTVSLNSGVNAPSVLALNNGTLQIFAQKPGPKSTDTFNLLTAKLTNGVNSNFQLAAAAIDDQNVLEFVFLSNGAPDGIQYTFTGGTVNGNQITGGTIFGPARTPDDEEIGEWSARSGGGEKPDKTCD